jgi:isopentenyl-diphosphate delta-isomerase
MAEPSTQSRKDDHLRIALDEAVEVRAPVGFEAVRLSHEALPELDLADVDPSVTFLGRRLAFPLLVGSMTGGTDRAAELNRNLAIGAARAGVGMFLGSQRVILERPDTAATFAVRDHAPDLPLLIGNIGAVQLNHGVDLPALERVVASVSADALVFHLNPAQEAVQPEGDTNFAGLAARLNEASKALPFPCGVKEVGNGLSPRTLKRLEGGRWAFIESAGAGGTSWTLIEGRRRPGTATEALGDALADWGLPSVTSLLACVRAFPQTPIVASGGLRSGLDLAKALALGATVSATALPLLKAAHHGADAVHDALMRFREVLVRVMFLTGARTLAELRAVPRAIHPSADPSAWTTPGV